MESSKSPTKWKDELFSNQYKTTDFIWAQTLGEGKYSFELWIVEIIFDYGKFSSNFYLLKMYFY